MGFGFWGLGLWVFVGVGLGFGFLFLLRAPFWVRTKCTKSLFRRAFDARRHITFDNQTEPLWGFGLLLQLGCCWDYVEFGSFGEAAVRLRDLRKDSMFMV